MFQTIKNALKTPEVRKKLLYTLLLIVIFRLGCYITVPGVDSVALSEALGAQNGITGLINQIVAVPARQIVGPGQLPHQAGIPLDQRLLRIPVPLFCQGGQLLIRA